MALACLPELQTTNLNKKQHELARTAIDCQNKSHLTRFHHKRRGRERERESVCVCERVRERESERERERESKFNASALAECAPYHFVTPPATHAIGTVCEGAWERGTC